VVALSTDEQTYQILIVEDDPDLRDSLVDLLSQEGYRVDTAESSPEALRKLTVQPAPKLILLDLGRPQMCGWQVLEALRAQPSAPKVAAFTSDAKTNPAGVVATLRKPFPMEDLMGVVAQCCH
jgi:CheY-like chemotaxis protein